MAMITVAELFESNQPQVLELFGESHALLGRDGPELIADYAKSLDRAMAVETSEQAPRAVSHLRAGLAARWAHRHEGSRIAKQGIPVWQRCPVGNWQANYLCCHFGYLDSTYNCYSTLNAC
jgi:hypothetical protein